MNNRKAKVALFGILSFIMGAAASAFLPVLSVASFLSPLPGRRAEKSR